MTDRYRIVKLNLSAYFSGTRRRWRVYLGELAICDFEFKRDAIAWIMKQEFHSNTEAL